jgi:hypothetical protein
MRGLPLLVILLLLSSPALNLTSAKAGPTPVSDPVVAAAGDVVCGQLTSPRAPCAMLATSKAVEKIDPDAVLVLGDTQYECGRLKDYQAFFTPSWGRFLDKIHPAIGDHEYHVSDDKGNPCLGAPPGAPGYWAYFGAAANPRDPSCQVFCDGYYSFDLGSWHLIALNSNCGPVHGCGAASPQNQWLRADLASHPNTCTLVYMHHPLFSSGAHGNSPTTTAMVPFWETMYEAGVDVVLAGHDHDYERFAPQTPDGQLDNEQGIREFVVGTGGRNHDQVNDGKGRLPNSEVFNDETFGILRLDLHETSYDWRFVPVHGGVFTDAGKGKCH